MNQCAEPLISVIVPCYNYGRFLSCALQSIQKQSYTNWECIIINDGSTDNTQEIAQRFVDTDARFKYIRQNNQGISATRNNAVKAASGKYIQFLDADDLIQEQKLELQGRYLEQNDIVDIVYGDALFFETNAPDIFLQGRSVGKKANKSMKLAGDDSAMVQRIAKDNFIEISAPLIRKSIFEKVGYFDATYKSYEDWHFWFNCALAGVKFKYLPLDGTLTFIRFGHSSLMTDNRQLVRSGIQFRRYMQQMLSGKIKRYNAYRIMKLYVKNILAGN
ncbi:MAG: glycosyltransferase [Bacteroidetes bacterium]|nr:glycosyltransferase [Bacteroidota bacterium]